MTPDQHGWDTARGCCPAGKGFSAQQRGSSGVDCCLFMWVGVSALFSMPKVREEWEPALHIEGSV